MYFLFIFILLFIFYIFIIGSENFNVNFNVSFNLNPHVALEFSYVDVSKVGQEPLRRPHVSSRERKQSRRCKPLRRRYASIRERKESRPVALHVRRGFGASAPKPRRSLTKKNQKKFWYVLDFL